MATIVAVATLSVVMPAGLVRAEVSPGAGVPPRAVAPGVTYERITDAAGPWVLHVVRVDPAQATTIDLGAGGAEMGRFSRPSEIGKSLGAVVAINGDFGLRSGHPLHPFLLDGSLMGRGIQNGANFAIANDETASFIGPDRLAIRASHAAMARRTPLAEWNSGRPARGEIVAYTRYGGSVEPVPGNACSARLRPDGPMRWGKLGVGIARRYTVDVRRCRAAATGATRRSIVLSARRQGTGAAAIKTMAPGDRVTLSWSFGWTHVMDSIGGMPQLVDGGVNVARTCGSYFCDRNPRTGVGVTADGTVLLVVVDGRSRDSVGMTLIQFARAFLDLGAVEALNLDGGGSSAMWIRGRGVVSDPSDSGGERAVVNAMVVLPGADPGERPIAAPSIGPLGTVGSVDPAGTGLLAMLDPGSTGGLADAMMRGQLGSGRPSDALVRAALAFRRSLR